MSLKGPVSTPSVTYLEGETGRGRYRHVQDCFGLKAYVRLLLFLGRQHFEGLNKLKESGLFKMGGEWFSYLSPSI